MAVTIGVSFLLVIPIEPIYWLLAPLAGLMIGYYANQRSNRSRESWRRVISNSLFAGVVTGLTLVALLFVVKFLFFNADDGYRDRGLGGQIVEARGIGDERLVPCSPGADCVYQRYLDQGKAADLAAVGVTDPASFSRFYWSQQLTTVVLLLTITTATGLVGGLMFAITRPPARPVAAPAQSSA